MTDARMIGSRLVADVDRLLTPRGRRILAWGLAGIGFVLAAEIVISHGVQGAGGLGGIDAIAYWEAAGRAWHGESLYVLPGFSFAAYQYPPPFAQILAPLSVLPMVTFVWGWRVLEFVCLRVAVGSWQRTGLALLVWPPLTAELDAGNIHLVMAAAIGLAMRGSAALVPPTFLLKFASWPALPISLLRDRRRTMVAGAITLAIVAASVILKPDAWREFGEFLGRSKAPDGWYNVLGGMPTVLRLVIAAVLSFAAIRYIRLLPIAVTFAYPVVWYHGLSTLVAVASPVDRPATSASPATTPIDPGHAASPTATT